MESYRTSQYRGYIAEIVFDEEARLYCGAVINSGPNSVAVFEVESKNEITGAFQTAVDGYFAGCNRHGFTPEEATPLADEKAAETKGLAAASSDEVNPLTSPKARI